MAPTETVPARFSKFLRPRPARQYLHLHGDARAPRSFPTRFPISTCARSAALVAFLLAAIWPGQARAGTFTAFGPQTYPRSTGQPIPFSNSFSVLNPATQYVLQIQVDGLASATLSINGVAVVFPSDFDMNETYVERTVVLQAANVLTGEVRGKPDGAITVTSEGANQTVTGTATDHARNSASASVTLNIDKTPPAVLVSYPADGAFTNASSLTVLGSVTDALSGIESVICNGVPASFSGTEFSCAVSLMEGSNGVLVEAADRAGNSATTTVTVTLDTTPPEVTITSPANGATFAASPITLTGTAADAASGTEGVTVRLQRK